jgi:competence protein ComEC
VLAIAILWALNPVRPDVLVADGGHAFAVRTTGGRLTIMKTGNDAFAVREWLAADGDARLPNDASLAAGFACDPVGCIARLADGSLASVALGAEAFAEDCARATIVLSARSAPPFCRATIVDRTVWRAVGAVALTRWGDGFAMQAARPATESRPWARPRERGTATAPVVMPPTPEAAPRADFGPDD